MSRDNKQQPPSSEQLHPKNQPGTPVLRLGIPSCTCAILRPMIPSFIPRPFPPPALEDIPLEYVIDQLHRLAPRYWGSTETTDCTLIIPVFEPPKPDLSSPRPTTTDCTSPFSPYTTNISNGHDGLGRRATEPTLHFVPRIVMKLHMDYLSSQSSFLRALFSGSNPLDLIQPTPAPFVPSSSHSSTPVASSSRSSSFSPSPSPSPQTPRSPSYRPLSPSPHHHPHLLPSPPNYPTIYLPVPDPASIRYLMHFIYFGPTDAIDGCLRRGEVSWDGLMRNAEYLGVRDLQGFLCMWARMRDEQEESDESDEDEEGDEDEEMGVVENEDECMNDRDVDTSTNQEEPARGRKPSLRNLASSPLPK